MNIIKILIIGILCVFISGCAPKKSTIEVINPASFYPEGPLWDESVLYYVEYSSHKVMMWKGGENKVFWKQEGSGPAAIMKRGKDRFIVTGYDSNELLEIDRSGKTLTVIKMDINGKGFLRPNDLVADSHGGMYVTMSGIYDAKAGVEGKIYYLSADNKLSLVSENLHYANGIDLTPDGKTLLVSEHLAKKVTRFSVSSPGKLSNRGTFVDLFKMLGEPEGDNVYTGPDGLRIDSKGRVFICQNGANRIVVTDSGGKLLKVINVPAKYITNVNFGENENTLYVTAATDVNNAPYPGEVYKISNWHHFE